MYEILSGDLTFAEIIMLAVHLSIALFHHVMCINLP